MHSPHNLVSNINILEKQNGICIIEWGEIIEDILPKEYTKITFSKSNIDENYRELKIEQIKC